MNINVGYDTSKCIENFIESVYCNIKEIDSIKNCQNLNYKKFTTGTPDINSVTHCYNNTYPQNKKYINILDYNNPERELECSLIFNSINKKYIKYYNCVEKINTLLTKKKKPYLTNKVFCNNIFNKNSKQLDMLKTACFLKEFNIIKFKNGIYRKIINSRYNYVNLIVLLTEINEFNDIFLFIMNGNEIKLNSKDAYFYGIFEKDCEVKINTLNDIYVACFSFEFEDPKL